MSHFVVIKNNDRYHHQAMRWCDINVGTESKYFINGNWYSDKINRWNDIDTVRKYVFLSQSDAVEFSLRWL